MANPREFYERAKRQGYLEGEQRTRSLVLTHLEGKYMNKELDTTSPEAQAILTLAREVSELLKTASHGQ